MLQDKRKHLCSHSLWISPDRVHVFEIDGSQTQNWGLRCETWMLGHPGEYLIFRDPRDQGGQMWKPEEGVAMLLCRTVVWIWVHPGAKVKEDTKRVTGQVPPRFELGSLDSKSRVLTITPWGQRHKFLLHCFPNAFAMCRVSFFRVISLLAILQILEGDATVLSGKKPSGVHFCLEFFSGL